MKNSISKILYFYSGYNHCRECGVPLVVGSEAEGGNTNPSWSREYQHICRRCHNTLRLSFKRNKAGKTVKSPPAVGFVAIKQARSKYAGQADSSRPGVTAIQTAVDNAIAEISAAQATLSERQEPAITPDRDWRDVAMNIGGSVFLFGLGMMVEALLK
jgi:hypothetical protein